MADFVAVIRRAVDGLTENTPEMRVKVYERARGAVQRQLESMKPRPPEEMLRRQLDKLETAIVEVEAEHAEALPTAEEPVAEVPVVHEEPQAALPEEHHVEDEHVVEEPEPAPAEVHAQEEVVAYVPAHEEPVHEEEPIHQEEPVHVQHEVVDEREPVEAWHDAPQEPEPVAAHHAEAHVQPVEDYVEPAHEEPQHYAEEQPAVAAEPEPAPQRPHVVHSSADDVISQVEEIWAEVGAPSKQAAPEPVMPAAAFTPAPFGHPVEEPVVAKTPTADNGFAWDADVFGELQSAPAAKPAQPARQMPDNAFDDVDLFADVHSSPKAAPKNEADGDGWRELKELAGFDKLGENGDSGNGSSIPPDVDRDMASRLQGKSFRMEPKRRRFGATAAILTLIGVAAVAGGGYAAWLNREALDKMVTDLISSAPKTATSTPSSDTASNNTAPATTPPAASPATTPAQNGNAAATTPAAGNTNVASLDNDPNTVNTKFTQRLLANGTEEDEGPAAGGQPGVAEGKSVAEQNVASAAPATGAAAAPAAAPAGNADAAQATQSPAATAPAATPPAAADQQASATPQQTAPVADGQKVFLYEERLGQTSPTAFEGTVTWSLQEGKGADGRPEPSVQGLINVPQRGLTATITVSRNTDSSLPASHLVELAFQVPPNFEGGAIDNVQRIALKSTEQDRGDALIAVPAKVTDDVYMVALNDFPDARKTNLDLLKTRNWIDIPVVYRNGRRALLTMEKGPTGSDAFNKAIAEWQALGGVAASSQ
ncbi:hypothetical protein G6K93_13900 [Agrobacterium rhizogenes]|uniref:hypothetical protein n=1 Tax=Rhizobium rhizogenes TaxID=359 RepID=UPI00123A4142|nr:hypothetical protein [Rhizobium rhizogenes]KAA6484682.1 hypothetical protein DXT98_23285 [Agrobacterium sp. ICMP 7243]NTF49420.1 hypothetical protein [Rhizobium rhizogenes]NTF62422.1 hypothetical protein [Rhizobium rhizogenes]NTG01309.1 hypothetical protein [Rhizobium rhizogenes]NTG14737.1 hypothetical protein [Rhizobium rhizogenes]